MSYFEEMIAHVKSQKTEAHTDSPWHTGTPTEEGWYLVVQKGVYAIARYDSCAFFVPPNSLPFYPSDFESWMKIPPIKIEPQHVKKLPKEWYDPSEDGLYQSEAEASKEK